MNAYRKRSACGELDSRYNKIRRLENPLEIKERTLRRESYSNIHESHKLDQVNGTSNINYKSHGRKLVTNLRCRHLCINNIPKCKYFETRTFRHVWSSMSISRINLNFCSAYDLREPIGQGGFGQVFYGRRRSDEKLVVMKIFNACSLRLIEEVHPSIRYFNPDLMDVPSEINALIELEGVDGVVKLREVYVSNLKDYILVFEASSHAMDLHTFIKKRGSLTEFEACHYFRQIVLTLQSMYESGFHHFDIKPANILIDQKSSKATIIDFGGALRVGQKHTYFVGTTCHHAPESNFGGKFYGVSYDSWCLGLLLLNMTTGNLPVSDDEKENSKRIFVMPNELSYNLKDLIGECLSRDRYYRPDFEEILNSRWIRSFKKVNDTEIFNFRNRYLEPIPVNYVYNNGKLY